MIPYRIIQTICRHIVAQQTLSGRDECICIDEPTRSGIVVSGLEVIESCLGIIDIATVAEGLRVPRVEVKLPGNGPAIAVIEA